MRLEIQSASPCGPWIATAQPTSFQYVGTVRLVPWLLTYFCFWIKSFISDEDHILASRVCCPFYWVRVFPPLTAGYGRRYCPRKNKRRGSHRGEVRRLCTPDLLGDGVFERIWRQVVRKDQRPLLFLWKPVAHRDTHLGLVVPWKTNKTSCPVLLVLFTSERIHY